MRLISSACHDLWSSEYSEKQKQELVDLYYRSRLNMTPRHRFSNCTILVNFMFEAGKSTSIMHKPYTFFLNENRTWNWLNAREKVDKPLNKTPYLQWYTRFDRKKLDWLWTNTGNTKRINYCIITDTDESTWESAMTIDEYWSRWG